MANIKLYGNTWDSSNIYDEVEGKTQAEVNSGLKTAIAQLEDVVIISDTEPTSETNKIWIDSDSDSVQVPTMDDLNNAINAVFPTETIEDMAIAMFNDGAENVKVKNFVVDIVPFQSGSGDPSSSNVRPLSGCTSVVIRKAGKNILPSNGWASGTIGSNNGKFTLVANANRRRITDILLQPGTYIMSSNDTQAKAIWYFYDKDKNVDNILSVFSTLYSDANMPIIKTLTKPLYMATVSEVLTDSDRKRQIEISATVSSFEQYKGEVTTITFPSEVGTVYAATLDVLNGVLAVKPYYSSYNGETLSGRWISDRDVYAEGTTPTVGAQVVDLDGEDTIYQIDANAITTVRGDNRIFTDSGNVDVLTYRSDIALYIEKKLSEV